ncbi:MAG: hypothetical protein AABZ53_10990 [Planctomycetota bacterium]
MPVNTRSCRSIVSLALLSLGGLAGCYSSWPPVEGASPLGEVNNTANVRAMTVAGHWALNKVTGTPGAQGKPIVFNLPAELMRSNVLKVAAAAGTQPLTETSAAVSTIVHMPRVWIRHDVAEIDVVYPNPQAGAENPYTMATLHMRSDGGLWTVTVAREWESLVREVPEHHYLPDSDYPQKSPEPARPLKTNYNTAPADSAR